MGLVGANAERSRRRTYVDRAKGSARKHRRACKADHRNGTFVLYWSRKVLVRANPNGLDTRCKTLTKVKPPPDR